MLNTTETKVKKSEACRNWVRGFNAIDQRIIDVLMEHDMESWTEVTLPAVGDRVVSSDYGYGEIITVEVEDGESLYVVEFYDWNSTTNKLSLGEFDVIRDSYLPMWSTMWNFGDWADDEWVTDKGITFLSECGFRVYYSEKYGYFFGIDGAGYNFYEAHWLPLYDAVGLKWHDVD